MTKNKIIWTAVIVLFVIGVIWLVRTPGKPGDLDSFAQCLRDSGAIYYGAFWCPNCKNQESMFGRSANLIPRIECSTPDGRRQVPACAEANITAYPTWDLPDGTRVTGTQSLSFLSEATSCPLPEGI